MMCNECCLPRHAYSHDASTCVPEQHRVLGAFTRDYVLTPPSLLANNLQRLLGAPIHGTAFALQDLVRFLQRIERTPGSTDARADQIERNDNPEAVHEHKIAPEIEGFRPRIGAVEEVVVEHARGIVEHVAVELAERDDDCQAVAQGVVRRDEAGGDEGEGAPAGLRACQRDRELGSSHILP
jgi:hypothetical protein